MKKLLLFVFVVILNGCAASTTTIKPLAPDNQATTLFKFNFITKKTVDVIIVSVTSNKTVVEDISTRNRFTLDGRYGKVGERFTIRY